jgi:hypothetical protein
MPFGVAIFCVTVAPNQCGAALFCGPEKLHVSAEKHRANVGHQAIYCAVILRAWEAGGSPFAAFRISSSTCFQTFGSRSIRV